MKALCVYLALAFFGFFWMEAAGMLGFAFCMAAGVLLVRFRSLWAFGLLLLMALYVHGTAPSDMPQFEPGEYRVFEVRQNYALAQKEGMKILLYHEQDVWIGDVVQVQSVSRIHSLNNTGLFSFESKMASRQVYYSASFDMYTLVLKKESLSARIYQAVCSHPAAALYKFLLYGYTDENMAQWISSLGLPFMAFFGWVQVRLQRRMPLQRARVWLLLGIVLYGHFFGWQLSLARLFVFRLFASGPSNKPYSFLGQTLVFLGLFPQGYREFCFVLPWTLSLCSLCLHTGWQKKAVSAYVLVFLQIVYFSSFNAGMLLAFGGLRSLLGWFAAASLCAWPLPKAALFFQSLLEHSFGFLEGFCFEGYAAPLVSLFMTAALVVMLWKPSGKTPLWGLGALALYMASFYLDPFFHVYVLDIGQGNCTLIVEPFKKSAVMIDAAGHVSRDNAQKIIVPFLKSRRIFSLDALIVTHEDFDHAGAVEGVREAVEVKALITDSGQEVPVDYPFYSLLEQREADDENDTSIVSLFSYDSFTWLWTGDASIKVEEQLLKEYSLQSDVLMLGHHGSATSSSQDFLLEVQPQLALVSAGYNNRYGHPSSAVTERLDSLGIDMLSTAESGLIHMASWKHWMLVETGRGQAGFLYSVSK